MTRSICGGLLRCAVVYAVLIVPVWGGLSAYRWAFCHVGNALFYRVGDGGQVRFEAIDATDRAADVTLRLFNRRTSAGGHTNIKTADTAYRPTAFLIALIVATPIPWPRRRWALLWGIAAVTLFVALRVWLRVADALSSADVLAAYAPSASWKSFLGWMVKILVVAPAPGYIVPALIWMVTTVHREDWDRLVAVGTDADAARTRPADRSPTSPGSV